jgi:hypothetical protein
VLDRLFRPVLRLPHFKGKSRLERVANLILEFYEWPERRGDNEQLLAFLRASGFEFLTVNGEPWARGSALPEHNLWARHR